MTILLLERLHPEAEALLAGAGPVVVSPDPNAPPADLRDVVAIVTRGRGRIRADLIDRCPSLRVIARAGAGLDNLDTGHAAARGIPVVFSPGSNTRTVAEHTIGLVLDVVRGITRTARQVAAGGWERRSGYQCDELHGLRLCVVGHGAIGSRVAVLAHAFGMDVVVAAHGGRSGGASCPWPVLQLEEALATADVVSLHVPLTPTTHGMMDARRIRAMKRGAFLVNTARGEVIDQGALVAALQDGHLGGCAADVLATEPPAPSDVLLQFDNVVLTPHVASLTRLTYRELCVRTARNVAAVLQGAAPEPQALHRARRT